MGLKRLLATVLLCATTTMVVAQTQSYNQRTVRSGDLDSVYYELTPEQIALIVQKIRQGVQGQTAISDNNDGSVYKALRYRLLMNLLAQPKTVLTYRSDARTETSRDTITIRQSSVDTYPLELRIARLERALQSLLLREQIAQSANPIVLHTPQNDAVERERAPIIIKQELGEERTVDTTKFMPLTKIEPIATPLTKAVETRIDTVHLVKVQRDTVWVRELPSIDRTVFFPVASSRLNADARSVLDTLVKDLEQYPDERFSIVGYASPEGNLEKNLKLARDRAEAVRLYLSMMGISEERLIIDSGGVGNNSLSPQLDRRVRIQSLK